MVFSQVMEMLSRLVGITMEISRQADNVYFSAPGCPASNKPRHIIYHLAYKLQGTSLRNFVV